MPSPDLEDVIREFLLAVYRAPSDKDKHTRAQIDAPGLVCDLVEKFDVEERDGTDVLVIPIGSLPDDEVPW